MDGIRTVLGMGPDFFVTRSDDERAAILRLKGAFDGVAAPLVRQAVSSVLCDGVDAVVLDLSEVEFIDSAGLGALVGAWKRAQAEGVTFTLRAPSPRVERALGVTALSRVFTVEPARAYQPAH